MKKTEVSPVLKWVGGKRQLIKDILRVLPDDVISGNVKYYEPFIGGGALFFHLQPQKALINDTNKELVNLYRVIKNNPEELIQDLHRHRNEPDYYYEIRKLDRTAEDFSCLSDVQKASRTIYLNKTCYNGLYRVNREGQYNTPFGRYKNPDLVNEKRIKAVSDYLNSAEIQILNSDFEESLAGIESASFVYLDPPYDPVSLSANFTSYARGGFDRSEQVRLKQLCDRLTESGVRFLLSNSATDFIRDLYKDYYVTIISARRAVNSKADRRGRVDEVLIRNYE